MYLRLVQLIRSRTTQASCRFFRSTSADELAHTAREMEEECDWYG